MASAISPHDRLIINDPWKIIQTPIHILENDLMEEVYISVLSKGDGLEFRKLIFSFSTVYFNDFIPDKFKTPEFYAKVNIRCLKQNVCHIFKMNEISKSHDSLRSTYIELLKNPDTRSFIHDRDIVAILTGERYYLINYIPDKFKTKEFVQECKLTINTYHD